jgi:hypothetical protein
MKEPCNSHERRAHEPCDLHTLMCQNDNRCQICGSLLQRRRCSGESFENASALLAFTPSQNQTPIETANVATHHNHMSRRAGEQVTKTLTCKLHNWVWLVLHFAEAAEVWQSRGLLPQPAFVARWLGDREKKVVADRAVASFMGATASN